MQDQTIKMPGIKNADSTDFSWKMLIDKEMTKMELKDAAGISAASIAKLGKGANITTDVLLKICEALDCKVEDIIETKED